MIPSKAKTFLIRAKNTKSKGNSKIPIEWMRIQKVCEIPT